MLNTNTYALQTDDMFYGSIVYKPRGLITDSNKGAARTAEI